ncbi:MAG: sulfatase-like hydrolase/transferase [bacterium]|nr:sulfatase-like hydrolase/transferase [bacterium]
MAHVDRYKNVSAGSPKAAGESMAGAPARAITRRSFLKAGALGAGAIIAEQALGPAAGRFGPLATARAAGAPAPAGHARPNFFFIISDQLRLDYIAAHGCPFIYTPNIDRLIGQGATFYGSHSTNPVCCPARSSLMTGRMPVETGVISNARPNIHPSIPNLGQWFSRAGYECLYSGKWHLPETYPLDIPGFRMLNSGAGQGDLNDTIVSDDCEAYLRNRASDRPFVLVASFMQPHDICYWAIQNDALVPRELPFESIAAELPPLPPNNKIRPKAPMRVDSARGPDFNTMQWRYYLYIYSRQIEMLDANIGSLLDALEDTGLAGDTVIFFTSDHGEGAGCHGHVSKWYPYDESVKVPFVVSCPGRVQAALRDADHLVSGLDVMSTMCDYAGIQPPPGALGRSLRPLLEGNSLTEWREFVVCETHEVGRTVRTAQYKYVHYEGDPVEMLFDMKNDPWETKNLYEEARYADVMKDHRKLLGEWEARMKPVA